MTFYVRRQIIYKVVKNRKYITCVTFLKLTFKLLLQKCSLFDVKYINLNIFLYVDFR